MTVMTRLQFSALALGIATLVGCAREPVAASCPKPVTVTNVIEQIREVAVTNVVTVTNAVVERRAPERKRFCSHGRLCNSAFCCRRRIRRNRRPHPRCRALPAS